MYKIIEIAETLGVSKVTVYKKVKLLKQDIKPHVYKRKGVTYIDNIGLNMIKDSLSLNGTVNQVKSGVKNEQQENSVDIEDSMVVNQLTDKISSLQSDYIDSFNDICFINKSIYKKWDTKLFFHYLEKFKIDRFKKVHELSEGMKSKLMLSVSLSHEPDLLVLDEITSGLDPVARNDVLFVLKNYIKEKSTRSVLFSTHITDDLDKISDRVIFIHEGSIIFSENKDDLLDRYLLIENKDDLLEVEESDVILKYEENLRNLYLVNAKSDYLGDLSKPSIDEIMLMFIKGRPLKCLD